MTRTSSAVIGTNAQPCPTCGEPTARLGWPLDYYHVAASMRLRGDGINVNRYRVSREDGGVR